MSQTDSHLVLSPEPPLHEWSKGNSVWHEILAVVAAVNNKKWLRQDQSKMAKWWLENDPKVHDTIIIMKTDTTNRRGPRGTNAMTLLEQTIWETRPLPTRRWRQNVVPLISRTTDLWKHIQFRQLTAQNATHSQIRLHHWDMHFCFFHSSTCSHLQPGEQWAAAASSGPTHWPCLQEPAH